MAKKRKYIPRAIEALAKVIYWSNKILINRCYANWYELTKEQRDYYIMQAYAVSANGARDFTASAD